MDGNKITVSLEETNSAQVDAELHRQDIASRMAEHQEKIRISFGGSGEMLGAKGGFFHKAIVYMTVFGLVFSILGWGIGEIPIRKTKRATQAYVATLYVLAYNPGISREGLKRILGRLKSEKDIFRNNEYLPDEAVDSCRELTLDGLKEALKNKGRILQMIWFITLGMCVSIGLAIAEGVVSRNMTSVALNGLLGALLGGAGGYIVSLFINQLYNALQGKDPTFGAQQIFARAVGWSILGAFLAIAPGILMRSWKKFLLGLAGGALGGLLGGVLFDPICHVFDGKEWAVSLARFVNIVGLGVGAAAATVFLENIAKQGWLRVAAGIIAGKQFILYRNPTVIGSSPKCEIYLFKDPSVAPKHAAVNNRNGAFFITAIEGATVLVNNIPIRQQKLKTGDYIRVGSTVFAFEAKALKRM